VVDVEGDPEAWTHFVHFLYTGLFADRSGDDAAFAEECGRSQVKKSLTTDDTEVVAQLLDINARHPVVGLADLLVESKGGAPRRVLPEREVIHSETLPPLVNALHDMLKQERQQKQQKAKLQDITLKLQQNGGDEPARSAHRFMLAARSTASLPQPYTQTRTTRTTAHAPPHTHHRTRTTAHAHAHAHLKC
jgi:hypothetical protein